MPVRLIRRKSGWTPESTPLSFEDLSLADQYDYDFDESSKKGKRFFPKKCWFKKKNKGEIPSVLTSFNRSDSVLDQGDLYKLIVGARWVEVRYVCTNHPEFLRERVKSSCRPPAISFNKTPLHVACIFQAPKDVISLMLNANHDAIREADESGKLPLHRAASSSRICASFEVIELLIKAYPMSIFNKDSTNLMPIELARRAGASPEILEILGEKEGMTKQVAIKRRKHIAERSNSVWSSSSALSEDANALPNLIEDTVSSGCTVNDFFNEDVEEKVNDASGAKHDTSHFDGISDLSSFNRTNNVDLSNETLGYRFCLKRDFVNAKKYLEMAIEDVILLKATSDLNLAYLCNDLGNVNFELNDFESAKKNYGQALRIQNLSLMGRSNVMFNLGNVHFKQKDLQQALSYYDDALRCFCSGKSKNAQMYFCLCNMKGLVYLKLGMLNEAVKYHQRTVEQPAESREIQAVQFRAYSTLGSLFYTLGQYEESYCHFKQSLKCKDEVVFYKSLHGMGNVCIKLGNLDKAFQHYLESLLLKRKKRGYRSLATACTLFNLGQVCRKLGRFEESLTHFDSLLDLHAGTLGEENLQEAIATIEKAKTLSKKHDFDKACTLYQDVFHKLSKLNSPKAKALKDDVDARMEFMIHRAYESQNKGKDVMDADVSFADAPMDDPDIADQDDYGRCTVDAHDEFVREFRG